MVAIVVAVMIQVYLTFSSVATVFKKSHLSRCDNLQSAAQFQSARDLLGGKNANEHGYQQSLHLKCGAPHKKRGCQTTFLFVGVVSYLSCVCYFLICVVLCLALVTFILEYLEAVCASSTTWKNCFTEAVFASRPSYHHCHRRRFNSWWRRFLSPRAQSGALHLLDHPPLIQLMAGATSTS